MTLDAAGIVATRRCALALPLLGSLALCAPAARAQHGRLLREVRAELEQGLTEVARRERLDEWGARLAPRAADAPTEAAERPIVHEFLAGLGISHLALYSAHTYDCLRDELAARDRVTLGLQLRELDGAFYACWLFEGGAAERAGVRRGDRVLSIDGVAPADSPRLDWRSDDAALADPPLHELLCELGQAVELQVERAPGDRRRLRVEPTEWGGWSATRHSITIVEHGEARIGYVHFWFVPFRGPARLLRDLRRGAFARCDAVVVDLRGRGGSASMVEPMVAALAPDDEWSAPIVCLTDRGTRSAKEVLASRFGDSGIALVVGERTAGAVIPATFEKVGDESVLMYPATVLHRHTAELEGVGVQPDVPVADAFEYAAGRDPIRAAGFEVAARWVRRMRGLADG